MEEDEELEKLRKKKLCDLINEGSGSPPKVFGSPLEVIDSTFYEVIKKNPVVVIDCWAAWCAPCRMIAPLIEELAKEYADKILFGKLDVDKNRKVPMEYQIMSIPTILIFKNGQLTDRIVGAVPKKILESRITQHL